jgi:hypothetical protein
LKEWKKHFLGFGFGLLTLYHWVKVFDRIVWKIRIKIEFLLQVGLLGLVWVREL